MTLTAVEYRWVEGRERSTPADLVASVIQTIQDREGVCPPDLLWREAELADAPLHSEFTWDDAVCGVRWRTHEARRLINSIEIIDVSGSVSPAFVSVTINEGERGYVSTIRIATDQDLREQALNEVRKALNGWRRRYRHLSDLWDAFDEVIDD